MTYVWDAKRGQSVPILVMQRETIAAETNIRTVMQRQGLADQIKIQQLCIRFTSYYRNTLRKQHDAAFKQWLHITTPSLIALEAKLRYEIIVEQEFSRLHDLILKQKDDLFELESKALLFDDNNSYSTSTANGNNYINNNNNNDNNGFAWMHRMTRIEGRPKNLVTRMKVEALPQFTRPNTTMNKRKVGVDDDNNNSNNNNNRIRNEKFSSFNPLLNQRRHMQRSIKVTTRVLFEVGTKSRLRYQQHFHWNKRSEEKLFYLRHTLPMQQEASLLLQRIGRASIARAELRGPMLTIFQVRALKVVIRFLQKSVNINSAKREAMNRRVAKEWRRSASLSIDRGLLLRIFTQVLQKYTFYAISTRLRAALHVVFRVEADARRKRFFVTAAAVLRKKARERKLREKIETRNENELRDYSAIVIQRNAKIFLTKLRVNRREIADKNNRLYLQELAEMQNYSARLIQSAVRQKIIAKMRNFNKLARLKQMKIKMREYNERRNYAACIIGRSWRAHYYSKCLKEELAQSERMSKLREAARLSRLNQPFDQQKYGGDHNPFSQRFETVRREIALLNAQKSNKDEPKIANFSNFAFGSNNKNKNKNKESAVTFTSRRDPVVPSAFAYLRGLPHAMAASREGLTKDQQEELRRQRQQRRKNIAAHHAKCKKTMKKIAEDPLGMNHQTREILSQSMGMESTLLPKIDDQSSIRMGMGTTNDDNDQENNSNRSSHYHQHYHQNRQPDSSRKHNHNHNHSSSAASSSSLSTAHFLMNMKKQLQEQKRQNISRETRKEAWGNEIAITDDVSPSSSQQENQQQRQKPVSSKYSIDIKKLREQQKEKQLLDEQAKKEKDDVSTMSLSSVLNANLYKF